MRDLISRQKLIEEMCSSCDMSACDGLGRDSTAKCFSIRIVEEQPTAFNFSDVIKKIRRRINCPPRCLNCVECDKYTDYCRGCVRHCKVRDALQVISEELSK